MPRSPGLEKQTPAQDCACGPDSLAGGHCPLAPGVSVLHLHPHRASLVLLMDKVTLRVSLPLPGALHGTDQLCILPSTAWSGIKCVLCLVLARFHPKGLPQEIFPLAVPGSGERGGWKGRESRQGLSRLPALGIVTSTSLDAASPTPLALGPCREVFSAWLVQRGHSTCSWTSPLCQGTVQLWEQPALLGSCSWPPKREGLDQEAAPRGMVLAYLCPQPLPPLFVSFLPL